MRPPPADLNGFSIVPKHCLRGAKVLGSIRNWWMRNKMTRRSPHRQRTIDYRTSLKYWDVPKVEPWMVRNNPTVVSLSQLREASHKGGFSSKTLYQYLRFANEEALPFVRLFKGPWRGVDGKKRNRVIVIFFPLFQWGLLAKPMKDVIKEQERWVEQILNPAFHSYKTRTRTF